MDPLTIALIALRSVGTLFTLQGRPEISSTINKALDGIQAGKNVDAYMAEIAEKLEADQNGEAVDWDDLNARIDAEVSEFLDDTGDD